MKKIILILAIAVATISFNASAQSCGKDNACKDATKCKQENCAKDSKCKHACTSADKCNVSACHEFMFKGITLTDAQKAEVTTLMNTCKAECTKSQTCDKSKGECKDSTNKKKFETSIKKILTPDQYTIFVNNMKQQTAKCTKKVSKCCK